MMVFSTCFRSVRPSSPFIQAYARVAAVGSLMMSITFNPAMRPASCVAFRRMSLK